MTDNSSSLTVGVLELALGDTIRRLKKRGAVCARLSGVGIAKAGLAAPERRNSDAAAITISLVSPPEM